MVEWNEMGKEEEGVKKNEGRGKVKIGEREGGRELLFLFIWKSDVCLANLSVYWLFAAACATTAGLSQLNF